MNDCMTQEDAMNMNNEQAVSILIPLRDMMRDQYGCPISDAYFALDKAIEALKQPTSAHWKIDAFGTVICSKCGGIRRDNRVGHTQWCNSCGCFMRGEQK